MYQQNRVLGLKVSTLNETSSIVELQRNKRVYFFTLSSFSLISLYLLELQVLKDNSLKDVWLYISAQGINLYEREPSATQCGPKLLEMFEWRSIQTLCYSKHFLCILPHFAKRHGSKLKKYKLKMDHKK